MILTLIIALRLECNRVLLPSLVCGNNSDNLTREIAPAVAEKYEEDAEPVSAEEQELENRVQCEVQHEHGTDRLSLLTVTPRRLC